ncbi:MULTISPECIES: hypothetical protein [unclassified Spiroplasma]|uniref:hypothetical protein n=1 Tax=unclassified Spiroplasma TaxID=2637901 RepID=UPI0030CB6A42
MVGGTVLAGGLIGGIIAISEILVQNEGVYQEKLNIFNWPESYGAISTLLNIKNDLYVGTSNGVYKIKDNASNTKDKIITPITGINGYISSLVVTNDGTVYVATFANGLFRYSPEQNILTQISEITGEVYSLVVMGNNVYVGTRTSDCYGKLFMIESNRKVSEIKDWIETYGEVRSLAVIDNDLYIGTKTGTYTGNLLIFKPNGILELLKKWNQNNGEVWSLIVFGNNLYVGSRNQLYESRLFKLSLKGEKITETIGWKNNKNYGEIWSLAVVNNDLYVGSRVQVIDNKFFKGGLYKSSDGGITFTEVFGWNKDYGVVVSLLPVDNNLYIGSKNYNDKTNQNYQGKLFFKRIK